jgi:hypothetical protein
LDERTLQRKYDELRAAFPEPFPNLHNMTLQRAYLGLPDSVHWECTVYDREGNDIQVRVFPSKDIVVIEPEDEHNTLVQAVEDALFEKGYVTAVPTRASYRDNLATILSLGERVPRKPPMSEGYTGALIPRKPPRSTTMRAN